jgi:hypothetical protein
MSRIGGSTPQIPATPGLTSHRAGPRLRAGNILGLCTNDFVTIIRFGMKRAVYLLLFWLAAVSATGGPVYPLYGSPALDDWLDHPAKRDAGLHLAFVEVIAVEKEQYFFTNAVASLRGRTFNHLFKVRSGVVSFRVIESPSTQMPAVLSLPFESVGYVASREAPWTDRKVVPGKRLLAFVRKRQENEWSLDTPAIINPVTALIGRPEVQSLFRAELATPSSVQARVREVVAKAAGNPNPLTSKRPEAK